MCGVAGGGGSAPWVPGSTPSMARSSADLPSSSISRAEAPRSVSSIQLTAGQTGAPGVGGLEGGREQRWIVGRGVEGGEEARREGARRGPAPAPQMAAHYTFRAAKRAKQKGAPPPLPPPPPTPAHPGPPPPPRPPPAPPLRLPPPKESKHKSGPTPRLTLPLDVLVDLRLEEGHLLLAAPLVIQQRL